MISDVKLSQFFLIAKFINRDVFLERRVLTLKSFKKQFQSIICFYFLYFAMHYIFNFEVWIAIWMNTTANSFCVDFASYNNFVTVPRESMISSVDKKWLKLKLRFKRLGFNLTRCSHMRCSIKSKVLLKHLCQSLVLSCNFFKKEALVQGLLLQILQDTSRWLLLFCNSCWLYTLHLYIAGNFQVVKRHQ